MTAEGRAMNIVNTILGEVQDQFIPDDKKMEFVDFRQKHNDNFFDFVQEQINQHTLSIIEKAVGEEERENPISSYVSDCPDRILSRVKSELGVE